MLTAFSGWPILASLQQPKGDNMTVLTILLYAISGLAFGLFLAAWEHRAPKPKKSKYPKDLSHCFLA